MGHGHSPSLAEPTAADRRLWLAVVLALVVLGLWAEPARAATPASPTAELSADEMRAALALGPWPPEARRDPGNRVSGQPLAIELGRQLFRDPRMSPVGYIACVTCHQPDRAFTDIKARAHGLADLPRNTPALANMGLQRWYGWGGASDSLWMASIKPILDEREFDGNAALVTRLFVREPELAACYRRVFGVSALRQAQRTVVNVGKALAAFIETLVTARTPFDEFRDALGRGDPAQAARYPAAAVRGLKLFVGRAGCVACHSGPNFSDGEFHPGVTPADDTSAAVAQSLADHGRLADARYLKTSGFNLLGPNNDDPTRRNAAATRLLVVHPALTGQYRTPSLRNVAVTAPYFHDGQTERLNDALQHTQRAAFGSGAHSRLVPREVDDLTAFLVSLTDRAGARRPWDPSGTLRCP